MDRNVKMLAGAGATAALVGGVAVLGAAGFMQLLKKQAAHAREIIGKPLGEVALDADKVYRRRYTAMGEPLDLLIVGDSIAAGLGATRPKGTLGARLAKELGDQLERPVRLRTVAKVGAETWMLPEQQLATLEDDYAPDVAVVIVGGNDVTHRIPLSESTRDLVAVIDSLRSRGAAVVVGTCPDLGALRPLPDPLRSLAARASRQLAAAQREAALEAGAHVVSLAHVVGPFFVTNPDDMFAIDQFHPSELGYRRTAEALIPSVLAALGERDTLPFGHAAPATT
ncbi:SGNH/GDSL hydrolase family protein [Nocardioides sp. Kera G14]|uniref:SGNH/GDSL hydrolase family protein n=1 Tax=Nocardioides sp. Kera G14 TaxID=2884264 RepID=UPI001D126321|nr:SGNH/GDSL hydrolase family protein [Nocardioides sp. Kera G14]UDY24209.1 SGNH/GDSL hydrolase family protein [Nocardioides sp. Kera G14]